MGEHELDRGWPATESAAVSDELDLDEWINGSRGLTVSAKIFRDGEALTRIEALRRELEIVKKIPKEDRGLTDQSPEQVEKEIEYLSAQVMESALIVHIQDRTDERRAQIRDRLVKELKADPKNLSKEDQETIGIHVLADAIVKAESGGKVKDLPHGFPPNLLRELRDRLGDSGLFECWQAFNKVTTEAPQVSAPLSRRNSSDPGGIT